MCPCVLEGLRMVKWREFLTFSVLGEVFICKQADSGGGGVSLPQVHKTSSTFPHLK